MAHWYDKDGNPQHFAGPNGRGTTLREARKLDLYPSVTTIGQVRNKPALVSWLQEQAAMEAGTYVLEEWRERGGPGPLDTYDDVQWARKIVASAREKTFAKADEGSDIHDLLEQWFGPGEGWPSHVMEIGMPVSDTLKENCGSGIDWIPEQSFTEIELGFAGKCDLHCPTWVVDFKTKDGSVKGVRGYPDQAEQLAAYAYGLGIPDARLANVFISRDRELWGTEDGVSFFEHTDPWAWERFKATLQLWQVCNKYGPYWNEIAEKQA